MEYSDFVQRLDEALQERQKFNIWRNVQISAEREVAILATTTKWNFVRVPVHLIVDYVRAPYAEDFVALFQEGLDYSKRAFGGGIRVAWSSFAVLPLIVCETAVPQTIEWVQKHQLLLKLHLKKYAHHGFDVYPVLYCLPTSKFYYWKGWDFVGAAVWPYSRRVIERVIIPGVSEKPGVD